MPPCIQTRSWPPVMARGVRDDGKPSTNREQGPGNLPLPKRNPQLDIGKTRKINPSPRLSTLSIHVLEKRSTKVSANVYHLRDSYHDGESLTPYLAPRPCNMKRASSSYRGCCFGV
ncbi:unnamed protein product [Ectocarpus sp. 12 AP-2014]